MYYPKRDSRFEYVFEAMSHIEERFCSRGCTKAEAATDEFPGMGCPVMDKIMLEEPVVEIDDLGKDGLFCSAREPVGGKW